LALFAGGCDADSGESRINPKPEKCLKTPQKPRRPMQALLGGLLVYIDLIIALTHYCFIKLYKYFNSLGTSSSIFQRNVVEPHHIYQVN
jgi:hypothetical protein